MRRYLEIVRFELRQQLASPFVWAAAAVFFLLHLLSITSSGISLWAHPQAAINSPYALAVVETTLTIFGMLPVVVFVAHAVLRDDEHATAELFWVKPVGAAQFLWGRFTAAYLLAALLGLAGLLGTLTGTLLPGLAPERAAPFALRPFLFCFGALVLPNLLILTALFFSVASLTRSLALTTALALVLLTLDLLLVRLTLGAVNGPGLLALADYSATLVVSGASRNLPVAELNTLYPRTLLLENRLLWLTAALAALAFSAARFRRGPRRPPGLVRWLRGWQTRAGRPATPVPPAVRMPAAPATIAAPGSAAWGAFRSQLRLDLLGTLRSPLFGLVLGLMVCSAISDGATHVGPVMHTPLYPTTGSMLGFFRYGLLQSVLVLTLYYAGMLVHRERQAGIADMVDASPVPDWVLPLAKMLALGAAVALLLTAVLLTAIGLQLRAGYRPLELGLYLRAVFLYNGVYYGMLCVLAVAVQTLVPNKWLGMLLLLVLHAGLLSLEVFGFEHVLYRFTLPPATYSDMNGFGPAGPQLHALIGYWGCGCALLGLLNYLLYPRGRAAAWPERIRRAAARFRPPVRIATALLAAGFLASGGWIFYNTNVLNRYQTAQSMAQAQAGYERTYGQYEHLPAPSFDHIELAVDLFPRQRRVVSRGWATLTNHKRAAISVFVLSLDPRLRVRRLFVDKATLLRADTAQGFYLLRCARPLPPGASLTLRWELSRQSRGFANARQEEELVENGTFVSSEALMPMPGFDDARKLTEPGQRRAYGLPAAAPLPALGDARFLDRVLYGVDRRSTFRVRVSTSADQTAVATGRLVRQWQRRGRRYFEYRSERPTWPRLYLVSARYARARATWRHARQSVGLEVYYHPAHARNIGAMLASAQRTLDYCTRAFGPYPYARFRILEYPRYRRAARAFPGGGVAYSEAVGWTTRLADLHQLDYTTIHELAHTWWGDAAPGARMRGRQLLNETLAQYVTLMVYKHHDARHPGPGLVNRITRTWQSDYLRARSEDSRPEQPVVYAEEQGYVSYNKGALGLYVLQEHIGEAAVNQALRRFLARFAFRNPPLPTARDLVRELRAVAGPEQQPLITDLFEKVMLYDLALTDAAVTKVPGGYELALTVAARQLEAGRQGAETEVPLRRWVDVGVFADASGPENQVPRYLRRHLLRSGRTTLRIRVKDRPAYVSLDPFQKLPDRQPDDNGRALP